MRPEMILPTLMGMLVLAGALWWIVDAHSSMWRQAAAHYQGASSKATIARKIPETIIITGRGAIGGLHSGNRNYRVYAASNIAIHADGLSIRQIPPFNIRCRPLFLPFDKMELKQTSWALWPEPFALRMRRTPELDIIVDRRLVRWIREHIERPQL